MDNTAAEILGLVLGLSGIGLLILANATDCWRHDAKDQFSSVGLSARCRGLWSECLFDNMANIWTCDIPLSYLGDLPVDMVVTRALVIVTCGVCVVGIVGLVCGMKCTTLVCDADSQKDKLTVAFGIPGVTYELGYSYWFASEEGCPAENSETPGTTEHPPTSRRRGC
ncbi:claudin-16-like [Amia ocellicauda]|uniref:claudin-16-like n=1 Tax=Amia ocellicauda TaxID=2972642 RepID=UPI003463D9D7